MIGKMWLNDVNISIKRITMKRRTSAGLMGISNLPAGGYQLIIVPVLGAAGLYCMFLQRVVRHLGKAEST